MADAPEARAVAESLARAQCPYGEIEAVLLARFKLPIDSVITAAEVERFNVCGCADLRARLFQVAMGEAEATSTATSTAMWLSRQALGHRADARAGDAEVREQAERFRSMTEAELRAEVENIRAKLGVSG